MDAAQPATGPSGPAPDDAGAPAPAEGMLEGAQALWRDISGLARDHLELALLETQRASRSVVTMLVYAIAAALLLVTSWLGLLAAIAVGLVALGLHPGWAILSLVALNLTGVFALYLMIKSNSANLRFPATVRSLKTDAALFRVATSPTAPSAT